MKQTQFYFQDDNAPKPNKPNHIGVCILIDVNGQILLEHRVDSDVWALIGGGLEIDESLIDGIKREVKEETGIALKEEQIELYKIYDDPTRIASYSDGNVFRLITVAYTTKLNSMPKLICSEESREISFFPKEKVVFLDLAKTHYQIVMDYLGL